MDDAIHYAKAAAYIAVGLAMAIGLLGPSLAQGFIGAKACENVGKYPENASTIRTVMMIALSFVETGSIYITLICGALLWMASSL